MLWDRNNIKQVAEKGELKCVHRSQGMWYIFHLIYLVLHISPNSRVSKHSMIYSFTHCSRCMIRSQKAANAINKTWSKVNYRLPFRVTLPLVVHYNDSFLHVGEIDRHFINFLFYKFSLCNKCLLYTRRKMNYQFQIE